MRSPNFSYLLIKSKELKTKTNSLIKKITQNRLGLFLPLISLLALLIAIAILTLVTPKNKKDTTIQSSTRSTIELNSKSIIDGDNKTSLSATLNPKEIDWVKSPSLNNNDLDVNGYIIEEIGSNQVFKGALDVPTGWKVEYSTDSYGTTETDMTFQNYNLVNQSLNPLQDIHYLKFTTTTAGSFKPFSSESLDKPSDDAFIKASSDTRLLSKPILFNEKIYAITRGIWASESGSYHLECYDMITRQRCVSDITYPAYFSSQNATFANPTKLNTGTKDINTSRYFEPIMDNGTYGHPGRVYIPAGVGANNYGVYCVDLSTNENCGYVSMGTTSSSVYTGASNPTVISGFVQKDSKIYGHANDWDTTYQTMICFDMATGQRCTNYSATTYAQVSTMFPGEHGFQYQTSGVHAIYGDNIYWIVPYLHGNSNHSTIIWPWENIDSITQRHKGYVLACFNYVNRSNCSSTDFSNNYPRYFSGDTIGSATTHAFNGDIQIAQNPISNQPEICIFFNFVVMYDHAYDTWILCKGVAQGTNSTSSARNFIKRPAVFQGMQSILIPTSNPDYESVQAWRIGGKSTTITDNDGHVKSYTPWHYGPKATKGMTTCYDWTTDNPCEGFTPYKTWTSVNNYASGDMGYVYDGSCLIGLGAQGYIWSFSPQTGTSPCRKNNKNFNVTIDKNNFYCDGSSRSINWGKVRLTKTNIYDFKNLKVKIYSSNGGTLLGEQDLRTDGTIDLSDAYYQNYSSLFIETNYELNNTSPWSNGSIPYISTIASSDNVQFCYKTELAGYNTGLKCNATNSIIKSYLKFDNYGKPIHNTEMKALDIQQDPNKQCFKDLKASIITDSSQVGNGEIINVKSTVENKANPDPLGIGNVPSSEDPQYMTVEFTIPNNTTVVSSSPTNAIISENKVTWNNQSIGAKSTKDYTIQVKTADSRSALLDTPAEKGKVYAATTQENMSFKVQVSYQGDIYSSDNSASKSVIFNNTTLENSNGNITSNNNDDVGNNTDTTDTVNTTDDESNEEEPNDIQENNIQTPSSVKKPSDNKTQARTYTPAIIEAILPESIAAPVESVLSAVGKTIATVPQNIAKSIPFSIILLLSLFALIYTYQAYKQASARRKTSKIISRLKNDENIRNEYIQIISHYLSTPIATIMGSIELIGINKEIPEDQINNLLEEVNNLSQHSNIILDYSSSLSSISANQNNIGIMPKLNNKAILLPLAGVLILAQFSNALFGWAGNYSANASIMGIQLLIFILGAIAFTTALSIYKNQRDINKLEENELLKQRSLVKSQNVLMQEISLTLSKDINALENISDYVTKTTINDKFRYSMLELKNIYNKIQLVEQSSNALENSKLVSSAEFIDILNSILSEFKESIDKKGIKITTKINDQTYLRISPNHLYVILKSLISNAITFNKDSGSITIETGSKNGLTEISISDTGIGIDKDKMSNIFKPFYRGTDTTTYDYKGIGLDLYIVKSTVENLNGSVTLSSKINSGTTIKINLLDK